MRSTYDRIRQALSFEVIGLVLVTPLFAFLFNHSLSDIGVVAFIGATAATIWNYLFNLGFDKALLRWRGDVRKPSRCGFCTRCCLREPCWCFCCPCLHGIWGVSLLTALMMDLAFALFYMIYAFVFTWGL